MTSSGTYNYNLSNGEIVLQAYERIGIRTPAIVQENIVAARRELNDLFVELSNRQVNLWSVVLNSINLIQGTGTYSIPAQVVMILDAYVSLNQGQTSQTDRYVTPLSRTEYATIAQKQTQGPPTQFWFDRLISPTVTMWPVPDGNGPYTFNYYACVQLQDANLSNAETPNVPYRWLSVVLAGLAYRLARLFAPNLEQIRKADYDEAWKWAGEQDTENVNVSLAPSMDTYYWRT